MTTAQKKIFDDLKAKHPRKVKLPSISAKQYELLCECIRYRAADNHSERNTASGRGLATTWYDNLETQLDELKQLLYNLK